MPLVPRHDTEADSPPSPAEYIILLVILIVVAVGYIFWWRVRRGGSSFALENLGGLRPGVRLSMEDDGPSAESFLTNNASSDSLPLDLEHQVPFLPTNISDEAAALADPSNESRFPKANVVNPISHHVANSPTLSTKPLEELVDTSPAEATPTPSPPPKSPSPPTAAKDQLNALDRELDAISRSNAAGKRASSSTESSRSRTPLDAHLVRTTSTSADDPLGATSTDLNAAAKPSPRPKPPSPHKYGRRSARKSAPAKRRGAIELSDSEDGNPNKVFTLDDDDDDE